VDKKSDDIDVAPLLRAVSHARIVPAEPMNVNLEISRGCGLDRRNEWRKVLLAWDDTRC